MNNAKIPNYDWLSDFIDGDTRVQNKVFDHFYYTMSYFAFKIIDNQLDAEAIASEAIRKMFLLHNGFNTYYDLRAFLYVAIKNQCYDYFRGQKKWIKSKDIQDYDHLPEANENSVLNLLIRAELMEQIYKQIERLPAQRKLILKLYFSEGLTTEEIANRLNLGVDTIRSAKAKGLFQLRKLMAGHHALSLILLTITYDRQ